MISSKKLTQNHPKKLRLCLRVRREEEGKALRGGKYEGK